MTIWLDATNASNWLNDTWVNNAPTATKTSNAVYIKGTWTSSNLVANAINGLPGIEFTGYNALGITDATGTYNAGATIFVVFQPNGADTYRTLVSRTFSSSSAYPAPFDIYANVRLVGNGSALTFFGSGANLSTLTVGTPYIFTYRMSNTSGTAAVTEWLNGNLQYYNLKLTSYGDTGTGVLIGTRSTKDITTFTGYMGEIMVYKTALTDAQVSEINLYLSRKWGIGMITTYPNVVYGYAIRIQRADNKSEFINIAEIQAFDSAGTKYKANSTWQSTTTFPISPSSNVIDDNPNTFAESGSTTDSAIQIAFTADNAIGKVVVVNRQDCCQDRMIGCCLTIMKLASAGLYMEYVSPKITVSQPMYEFTFETQNLLTVSYYGSKTTENVSVFIDNVRIASETLTTAITRTYKIGYKPTTISISYNNDSTVSGDVYITKLEYDGTNLLATYTNSSSSIQTTVRNGTLAWGMTYTFSP